MEPKDLPAKAARDVPHEPRLREAAPAKPDQAEQATPHLAAARVHLGAKTPFEAAPGDGEAGRSEGGEAAQPSGRGGEGRPQQPPHGGSAAASAGGEYYVRLTVRVDHGALSVVDSHVVEGPLAQTTTFHGPFAYEVTDGGRLLHAGSIPDLGTVRAFANMEGSEEQHRHHTYQLETYEFDVRVPAAELRQAALANVAIILHRVKAPDAIGSRASALAAAPLATQRGEAFREIGRVTGIPSHLLAPEFRSGEAARPAAAPSRGFKQRQNRDEDEERGEGEAEE